VSLSSLLLQECGEGCEVGVVADLFLEGGGEAEEGVAGWE